MTRNSVNGIYYSMNDDRNMITASEHWTKPNAGGNSSLINNYMTDEQIEAKYQEKLARNRYNNKKYQESMRGK